MIKLKTFKYKTNTADSGILDKISKRYSTYRLLRKSPGRNGGTPQPASASYDMTGRESDDHKLEIGAPVLISKTTIDSDLEDFEDAHSRINDGVRLGPSSERSASSKGGSSFGELKFSFFTPSRGGGDDQDYDIPRSCVVNESGTYKPGRSKSATNLHRTELSVCLQRAPSLKLTESGKPESPSNTCLTDIQAPLRIRNNQSLNNLTKDRTSSESAPQPYPRTSSKASLNRSSIPIHESYSRESLGLNSSMCDEDFDLKSASCQSLNARNLFVSIEELHDITKQINESDDFKPKDEVDLEYCAHRDKLRPVERRITLLRNKNNRLINMGGRKDKITNAWSGFKSWIGEESGKIREVVHKHAALQRVGANFKGNGELSAAPSSIVAGSKVANVDAGNSIVRNQDFFDQVRTSITESSNDVGTVPNRKLSMGNESISDISGAGGNITRGSSYKKTGKEGDQAKADDGWEVNLFASFFNSRR